jgi:hypothetical protein
MTRRRNQTATHDCAVVVVEPEDREELTVIEMETVVAGDQGDAAPPEGTRRRGGDLGEEYEEASSVVY